MGLVKIPGVEPYPPFLGKLVMELYILAGVLLLAMDGEKADIQKKLPGVLRLVETPFGNALAVCAGEARKRGPSSWAAFSAAVRLPGWDLVKAVCVWIENRPAKTTLEKLFDARAEGEISSDEADYYHWAIQSETSQNLEAWETYAKEYGKKLESERKRKRRDRRKRTSDVFDDIIRRDWITEALWCRTTKGILDRYSLPQGTGEEVESSLRRIDRAISDAGFSDSRHSENEPAILAAVEAMRCQLARLT